MKKLPLRQPTATGKTHYRTIPAKTEDQKNKRKTAARGVPATPPVTGRFDEIEPMFVGGLAPIRDQRFDVHGMSAQSAAPLWNRRVTRPALYLLLRCARGRALNPPYHPHEAYRSQIYWAKQ